MVESRNGFFEAYRHTLKSLQKMSKERCSSQAWAFTNTLLTYEQLPSY